MKRVVAIAVLACLVAPGVEAKPVAAPIDTLGPYRLGASYDELKKRPGFTDDKARTKPAEGIVAAKIIDKEIEGSPTLQRLLFKDGKLQRVSIIFFPPEKWTEAALRDWLAKRWGDPGPKETVGELTVYVWKAEKTSGFLLPADKGSWMASLTSN